MARNRDNPRFGWVVIVPMTSASPDDPPAVGLHELDGVSDLHLDYFVSISNGHPQTKVFHKRIKVSVIMQQLVSTFDAPRGDHYIDGPADRDALAT
jgi:hypothetical protein